MEELRGFPALRSPEQDTFPSTGPATARPESGYFGQGSGDARASLQRRFTTDASKMSPRPFGGQQFGGGMPQPVSCSSSSESCIYGRNVLGDRYALGRGRSRDGDCGCWKPSELVSSAIFVRTKNIQLTYLSAGH